MPMSYVCDMDGVIYHGNKLIPGALDFVQRLQSGGHKFLFLTTSEQGLVLACGALVAPIELATGKKPYFVGKPNPIMMWTALRKLDTTAAEAFMVGDRMDTDIIAGTEASMKTILVLSGVTSREMIDLYPYRPTLVFEDVGHIPVDQLG